MIFPILACELTFTVFAVLIRKRQKKTIDTSQARIGHSDESTRSQVKGTINQSEVFTLLDFNDLICFDL